MLSTNIDCYKVCLAVRLVGHPLGPLAGQLGREISLRTHAQPHGPTFQQYSQKDMDDGLQEDEARLDR